MSLFFALVSAALVSNAQVRIDPMSGPGTRQPSSGNCGFPSTGSTDELKSRINEVFTNVYGMFEAYSTAPDQIRDTYLSFADLEPSNPSYVNAWATADHVVVVSLGICMAAQSPDELASVFAHELSHIEHRDSERYELFLKDLWNRWLVKQDQAELNILGSDGALEKFAREGYPAYVEFQRPKEDAADFRAVQILSRPGSPYKPVKGANLMAHFKDSEWAFDYYQPASATSHSTFIQRAENIQAWAPQ
jgi:predicted Zn-dependent protease